GIRDLIVTGVQTCALPICAVAARWRKTAAPGGLALLLGDFRSGLRKPLPLSLLLRPILHLIVGRDIIRGPGTTVPHSLGRASCEIGRASGRERAEYLVWLD